MLAAWWRLTPLEYRDWLRGWRQRERLADERTVLLCRAWGAQIELPPDPDLPPQPDPEDSQAVAAAALAYQAAKGLNRG